MPQTTKKKSAPSKKKTCAQRACKAQPVADGFCRLHYIANRQRQKAELKEKAEKRLNAYVARMTKKYPKEYLQKIREGLEDDEKFQQLIEELELENEGNEKETEREFLERFKRGVKPE